VVHDDVSTIFFSSSDHRFYTFARKITRLYILCMLFLLSTFLFLSYRHAVIFANLRKVKQARCPRNHLNQFEEDKMKREEANCVFSHSTLIKMRATIMKMSLDNVKQIISMKRTCMHIRISFYVSTIYNCCEESSLDLHSTNTRYDIPFVSKLIV